MVLLHQLLLKVRYPSSNSRVLSSCLCTAPVRSIWTLPAIGQLPTAVFRASPNHSYKQCRTIRTVLCAGNNVASHQHNTVQLACTHGIHGRFYNSVKHYSTTVVRRLQTTVVGMATTSKSKTNPTHKTGLLEKLGSSSVDLSPDDAQSRYQLRQIFLTAVEAVMPRPMLEKVVHFNPNLKLLTVEDRSYKVQRNVFVVGAGKAVLGMARVIEDLLGEHIIRGILSIPDGAREVFRNAGKMDLLLAPGSKIAVQEGAKDNLPDQNAFLAARDIHKLISNLTPKDIVIVLLSGGGSALLPCPVSPLTLDDIQMTCKEMFNHGASISEVNTVRKQLEVLKGGGMAQAAMPAQVISLIISDVIGDPLDVIASGPTVNSADAPPHRSLEVIKRLGATKDIPPRVLDLLEKKKVKMAQMSQLMSDPRGGVFSHTSKHTMDWTKVHNVLVGSNAISCAAAATRAQQEDFVTYVLAHDLSGEARQIGTLLGKLGQYICACYEPKAAQVQNTSLIMLELELAHAGISKNKLNEISSKATHAHNCSKALCLIAGGETTVSVTGNGKGGRNQEMVLAAGIELQKCFQTPRGRKPRANIFFMSAGTDGQDGPTDAAGAVVDENFMIDAHSQGLNPQLYLDNNDSYNLWKTFANGRDLVITGLTGTNVMDIQILIVKT